MAREVEVRIEDSDSEQAEDMLDAPLEETAEPGAATGEKPLISDLSRFLRHTRTILPTAVLGLFLLALTAFLYFAKPFVMPIVIAALLTFLLKPLVRGLAEARIPQVLGALIVIAVFFAILGFGATRLLAPAAEWASKAPETATRIDEKFHDWVAGAQRLSRAAAHVENIAHDTSTQAQQVEVKEPVVIKTVVTYTKSFVAGLIETVVLLFFMLAAGDLFMEKLVRVLPTLHDKKKAVGIAAELQHSLSAFLLTITMINAVLGTLVGFAAWLIGLPNPALWGALAGLLNFIPYFGPITGVVVLTVAGFVTFDHAWRAILPAAFYLGLHGVEANIITPMILGRRLTLNPLVIFISLMFWTWLWGIPGALLSIPMLMMLKIFCDHFKPMAPLGEFLSGSAVARL